VRLSEVERAEAAAGEIHGWFSREAGRLFAWVDRIQKRNGVGGDVFEIGVHHGKSTRYLGAMVEADAERLAVCDLFGEQEENISDSGRGELAAFRESLAPLVDEGLELEVFRRNSMSLTPEEIGRTHRFFHIDGGHDAAEALSDLELAADAIVDAGVIALDDPFRAEWPGVTEALVRFLDAFDDFRATAVGFNKILLTRDAHAGLYRTALQREEERREYGLGHPWHLKELPFHGDPLLIFFLPTYLDPTRNGGATRSRRGPVARLGRLLRDPVRSVSAGVSRALSWLRGSRG